jgi:NAD(P)-dependent dehydrogenase (short-subunit alcohol dehydrogenase family)
MGESLMKFEGKVALVTGGGNGIGHCTCLSFAAAGAKVMVVDLDRDQGLSTVEEIRKKGGEAEFCRADVSRSEDVQRYVTTTIESYGRIDAFFNNAGIEGKYATLTEYAEEDFNRVIDVNLKGAFLGLKYVLRIMVNQRFGCIVNCSSVSGLRGASGHCAYVASKNAVIGLTRVAAAEVGKHSIRVNAICPGPIDTRMMNSIIQSSNPGNRAEIISRNPSGRFGMPNEVAQLVLYLTSDDSSYVHGAVIPVDGGRTAI